MRKLQTAENFSPGVHHGPNLQCLNCPYGKQTWALFQKIEKLPEQISNLIVSNLCGPFETSIGNFTLSLGLKPRPVSPTLTSSETRNVKPSQHHSKTTWHSSYNRKTPMSKESGATTAVNTQGKSSRIYALISVPFMKLPHPTHQNTTVSLRDITKPSKKEHSPSDTTPDYLVDSEYQPSTQSTLSKTEYYTHAWACCDKVYAHLFYINYKRKRN